MNGSDFWSHAIYEWGVFFTPVPTFYRSDPPPISFLKNMSGGYLSLLRIVDSETPRISLIIGAVKLYLVKN